VSGSAPAYTWHFVTMGRVFRPDEESFKRRRRVGGGDSLFPATHNLRSGGVAAHDVFLWSITT